MAQEQTSADAPVWHEALTSFDPVLDDLAERLTSFVALLPVIAVALLIVALSWWISRRVRRSRWLFGRFSTNPFVRDMASRTASLVILGLGCLLGLELVGATSFVAALLGTAGVVGLAVGFAFRDLAENFISSVLLSLRQPFAPNDHVQIDGQEGRVVRLTSRATILMTLDGNHLRIPNADVFKGRILNFTRNPERRFKVSVGVDTNADLLEAKEAGLSALTDMRGVLASPEPEARIVELGDSSVKVDFFGWVDQREYDFLRVQGEAVRRVKIALEEAGVEMPEPIYRLRVESREVAAVLHGDEGVTAAQPDRERDEKAIAERDRRAEADLEASDPLADAVVRELEADSENLLDSSAPVE